MQVSDEKRARVETTLIGAVGAGDRHAFETLYRTYNHRLHQYLRMLLRDEAQVEEVVVETMVAVWSGAKTFRGGSQVSTWIFGIARHKALDALRRMTRADRRSVSLDDLLEQPDPHDGPEVAAEQESLARVTQRALAALSAAHQEAIRLAYYEELSYEEMASVVGCPINTIKSRLFKAKQQLKQSLERLGLRTEMR